MTMGEDWWIVDMLGMKKGEARLRDKWVSKNALV